MPTTAHERELHPPEFCPPELGVTLVLVVFVVLVIMDWQWFGLFADVDKDAEKDLVRQLIDGK